LTIIASKNKISWKKAGFYYKSAMLILKREYFGLFIIGKKFL